MRPVKATRSLLSFASTLLFVLVLSSCQPGTSPTNNTGGANSANRISQLANRHLRELGVDGTLHGCRHRFGTQALLACGNVRTVQELLGHASIITTQLYTAIASPEMVAVVLAVQPANPIPNSAA